MIFFYIIYNQVIIHFSNFHKISQKCAYQAHM